MNLARAGTIANENADSGHSINFVGSPNKDSRFKNDRQNSNEVRTSHENLNFGVHDLIDEIRR